MAAQEFQELKERIKRLNSEKATRIQEENKTIREMKKRIKDELKIIREENEMRIRERILKAEKEIREEEEKNLLEEFSKKEKKIQEENERRNSERIREEEKMIEFQERMEKLGNMSVDCICGTTYQIKDTEKHRMTMKHIRLSLINQARIKKSLIPEGTEETKSDA